MLHKMKRSYLRKSVLLLFVATASLLVWGCGGGGESYDEPKSADNSSVEGAATEVLITPSTLKSWIDDGLVNRGGASPIDNNVVIFDFGKSDEDRIPGAIKLDLGGQLTAARSEGVGLASPMVTTGAQMDAVIQSAGIDENTVIVFTGSTFSMNRAYWTFRYWGFPQNCLKVLDGGIAAYENQYALSDEAPTVTPSSYSVKNLAGVRTDLRASVGEMIELVKVLPGSETDIVFDARGDKYYTGSKSTGGKLSANSVVVVDGHPEGGQYLSWGTLYNDDGTYKSAEEIEVLFSEKGWTEDMKATVYCTSAYSATPLFFALDAILGADVQLYDGSWSQFGKYSDYTDKGGELPAGSPWAIDSYLATDEGYRYSNDYLSTYEYTTPIDPLLVDVDAAQAAPFDAAGMPVPSQVEEADADYVGNDVPTVSFAPIAAADALPFLITPGQLDGLMDAELLDVAPGSEEPRLAIIDVTDSVSFVRSGHIEGAKLWSSSVAAKSRVEGVAPAVNMVLDGETMDQQIQKLGIDEDTIIVLTSTGAMNGFPSMLVGRVYLSLRYYGFPKERIKVLNGYNPAWEEDGYMLSDDTSAIEMSGLSVKDIANHQPDVRASLSELMYFAKNDIGTAVDFRGDKTGAQSTKGVFPSPDALGNDPLDYVVFEGGLNNGSFFSYKGLYEEVGGIAYYKSAADIQADMGAVLDSVTSDGTLVHPVITYCRTGYIAAAAFLAMDGILGLDAMIYDGSWSQWGKMSADAEAGGELVGDDYDYSAWATDSDTYMTSVVYNADFKLSKNIETLDADAEAVDYLLPSDAEANQIENADTSYQQQTTDPGFTDAPTNLSDFAGGGC